MKLTEKDKQLIATALDKHEASLKRLKGATNNKEITKVYENETTELINLRNKIINGQGALTL